MAPILAPSEHTVQHRVRLPPLNVTDIAAGILRTSAKTFTWRDYFETSRGHAASLRDGEGLPTFVEQEFRDCLRCGCWPAASRAFGAPHGYKNGYVTRGGSNEFWRRRPDLNRGWRFCRQGRDVHVVDSSCFLVGPTLPFSPVFGRYCSQIVPTWPEKHARRRLASSRARHNAMQSAHPNRKLKAHGQPG
jgi:hypothetical protein